MRITGRCKIAGAFNLYSIATFVVAKSAGQGEGEGERGAEQRQPPLHSPFAGSPGRRGRTRTCGVKTSKGVISTIRSASTPPRAVKSSVRPGEREAARRCLDPRETLLFLCLKSPASCHLAPVSSLFSHTCSSSRSLSFFTVKKNPIIPQTHEQGKPLGFLTLLQRQEPSHPACCSHMMQLPTPAYSLPFCKDQ